MVNVYQKKILLLAVYAGEIMMKNGAEIYRVEDTITRICKACGISHIEVFATPTGIFVSLDKGGDDDDTQTYIKRIRGVNTDLNKISLVNKFSREFTTTDLSVDDGMKQLSEIDSQPPYPIFVRILGACMIASFFCLIFGGNAVDFCISFIAGGLCLAASNLMSKSGINFFIKDFCCSGVAAVIAVAATSYVSIASYDSIIIGTLMIFVPGVAITNSIRDFLSGDMLSGLARMTEAVLTAVALAVGAGVVIKLWSVMGGGII